MADDHGSEARRDEEGAARHGILRATDALQGEEGHAGGQAGAHGDGGDDERGDDEEDRLVSEKLHGTVLVEHAEDRDEGESEERGDRKGHGRGQPPCRAERHNGERALGRSLQARGGGAEGEQREKQRPEHEPDLLRPGEAIRGVMIGRIDQGSLVGFRLKGVGWVAQWMLRRFEKDADHAPDGREFPGCVSNGGVGIPAGGGKLQVFSHIRRH